MLDITLAATGEPLWTDPRHILREVVSRLAADGLHPTVAFEYEFYLIDAGRDADGMIRPPVVARTGRPLGPPTNLAVSTLEEVSDWTVALQDAARAQDLPMGAVIAEMGIGQFEVNLRHRPDAVRAYLADYVDGLAWYYDKANRAKAIEIVSAFTKSPREVLDSYFATDNDYYRDPSACLTAVEVQKPLDAMAEEKLIDRSFDTSKYINLGYLPKPCAL